ncbi:Protein LURP-one-related like [Actinidia chinensis var. chinensis]|uniref:Protein LURP-one-related like n=1 Tax=Actinidia chinensis var. chinensis TaxID=1590841 RepID=A0A2R6RXH7_ACTCC|nr:Protein LURP-one-related like [Actinidia chinensis var. chinensis]
MYHISWIYHKYHCPGLPFSLSMAQSSYATTVNPVSIIGPQYYLPHPVDLAIVRKVMALAEDKDCTADGKYLGARAETPQICSSVPKYRWKLWLERSCAIYAGESSTIVAQLHKKHSAESILLGKDRFTITVYPQIDYAFIDALLVIIDDINKEGASCYY